MATNGDDFIITGGRNDRIGSGNGDDTIEAGGGRDRVNAGRGDDTVFGGGGADRVSGGDGDDLVDAGAGADEVFGGDGNDSIYAGGGRDRVFGGNGDDRVDGGSGNDVLFVGDGDDSVAGGAGDDAVFSGDGNDSVDGGSGDDTLNAGDGIDHVDGGAGNDLIAAGGGNDSVAGGSGHDVIDAGEGNDSVTAGSGDDWVLAGDGDDSVDAGAGSDLVDLGSGDDTLRHTVLAEATDKNVFQGGSGFDTLVLVLGEEALESDDIISAVAAIAAAIDSGQDSFESEELGLHLESFESLEVVAPVIASDDSFTTDEDSPAILDVLANDEDILAFASSQTPSNDALRITGIANVSGPAEVDPAALAAAITISSDAKSVSFDPTGLFDYLSVGDPDATVSFTYTIEDDQGFTDTATATVSVEAVNDAPIPSPGAFFTDEDSEPISLNLLEGQTDPDVNDLLTAIEIRVTDGQGAAVPFSTGDDGTIVIDPAQFSFLGGDESAELNIDYNLSDATTSIPNRSVLTVAGVEDPIVITGEAEGSVQEDGMLVDSGQLLASDADGVDNPSFTPQTGTAGTYGSFDIDADGNWTYTLDNDLAQEIAGGQVVIERFTVEASNADDEAATETVEVTVTGAEDPIVIAGNAEGSVKEDGVIRVGFVFMDENGNFVTVPSVNEQVATGRLTASDADAVDMPSFTPQSGTAGTYGSFSINANGNWTYTLFNDLAQELAGGQIVTERFTVEATTADGETATQTVEVIVTGAEDPIIIAGNTEGAVAEDGDLSADGALAASDSDSGDDPSFRPQTTAGTYGSFTIDANGTWTYTLDNDLAQELAGGQVVTERFPVEAANADGEAASETVEVTVTGAEDPIVIVGDADGSVKEDGAIIPGMASVDENGITVVTPPVNEQVATGRLTASDADAADRPNFTPQSGTAGTYGSFSINANGNWTYTLDNDLAQELAGGQVVTESFTVEATTADGESASETVEVTVTGAEDPIVIAGNAEGSVKEDGVILEGMGFIDQNGNVTLIPPIDETVATGRLTASDADSVDTPSFAPQSETAGTYGSFSINADGNWTYTLDNDAAQELAGGQIVTESFTVEATTADGETATESVEISVTGAEDPILISGDTEGTVIEDGLFASVIEAFVDADTGEIIVEETVLFDEKSANGSLAASDADAGDTPIFTAQAGTAGAYGSFEIDTSGNWRYELDNELAQPLRFDEVVTESFLVEATNADGEVGTETVEIDVVGAFDEGEAPFDDDFVVVAPAPAPAPVMFVEEPEPLLELF
ncbi:MAG: VCBS domain-containing protein [Pseudomonadota bacterium]